MDDMTAKEEFIFLFKAYLKQAGADVEKWTKHLERLEGKTDPVADVLCNVGLVAPVVDDEMLVRALRKAIEVGLLPAYGSQDHYLKNWDRMKEVLQAAVGN